MKTRFLALFLLAGSAMFAETRIFVSIGGGYPSYGYGYYSVPPPVVYAPPCPGPGYYWVPGSWFWVGAHRHWHAGYWAPPVFGRAYIRVGSRQHGRDRYDRGYRSGRFDGRSHRR